MSHTLGKTATLTDITAYPGNGEIVYLFAVHTGDGERTNGTPRWFFTSKLRAEEVANGRGWYGGNSPISDVPAIRVVSEDSTQYFLLARVEPLAIDVSPDDELRKKQVALSKLTPEERKLLGV